MTTLRRLAVRCSWSVPVAIVLAVLAKVALAPTPVDAAASCESLASLTVPGTTVTSAQSVAAGAFTLPAAGRGGRGAAQLDEALKSLPAFCRIETTLKPSSDSDIKVEVWMPVDSWNGKLQAVGNGGWTGNIAYPAMVEALRRGYATSSTDTGHTGGSASFALGHPEKLIDFGYRSVHEMTGVAKKVIAAFYGNPARLAYWNGCSAGGRQGLKEAQMFATDYDGIIAGAPALDWTGRASQSLRVGQAMHKDEASYIPPGKYPVLRNAVLEACDARDGVKDGVLENPTHCKFDPKVIECKGADEPSCLTAPQVEAARKAYASATNSKTKREITGLEPGSELGWATWGGPQPFATSTDHFRVRRVQGSQLGSSTLHLRHRRRPGRTDRCRRDQRAGSQSQGLFRPQGETDSVPRLGRSSDLARRQRRVLQERARGEWGSGEGSGLVSTVHGSRHGALRRWRRPQYLRHVERARAVGGAWQGAGSDRRVTDS